ncbi:hypothetical protein L1987_64275 [Smallanthus sonchifolius]|uniref:Uncharacterized protein n=1 Tax=Smallanthus sonchifolius TaxID=185202 RepID=A0ACB9CFH7_9ASTR|nr:hypothetical protein L1987_64275 [Smallanthus sonchifolius]
MGSGVKVTMATTVEELRRRENGKTADTVIIVDMASMARDGNSRVCHNPQGGSDGGYSGGGEREREREKERVGVTVVTIVTVTRQNSDDGGDVPLPQQ